MTNNGQSDLSNLKNWLDDACSRGAVAVITGMNGDMDTIGSAISLAASHSNMMACGVHLGRVSRKVCEKLSAPFRKINSANDLPSQLTAVVIVDAASPSQIGFDLPANIAKCIIDHHATNEWEILEGDILIQQSVSATTEIIANYLDLYFPQSLTSPVRKLLLAGLITDSGRFKHAKNSTFAIANKLLIGSDINYQKYVEWLENNPTNSSEKGTLLRGLQKSQAIDSGEWSIIYTNCGTLEGRMAGLLLGIGHDVSLVSRSRDGTTRLTARATKKSTDEGIKLGLIMQKISQKLGGDGGGHDGAAGWSGNADRIAAESAFISEVATQKREVKNND